MTITISKQLSSFVIEFGAQTHFRTRASEMLAEFGKGDAKPIDCEISALERELGITKMQVLAKLINEGFNVALDEPIEEEPQPVITVDGQYIIEIDGHRQLVTKAVYDVLGDNVKKVFTKDEL